MPSQKTETDDGEPADQLHHRDRLLDILLPIHQDRRPSVPVGRAVHDIGNRLDLDPIVLSSADLQSRAASPRPHRRSENRPETGISKCQPLALQPAALHRGNYQIDASLTLQTIPRRRLLLRDLIVFEIESPLDGAASEGTAAP